MAGVAAAQPEERLEERGIALSPVLADAQVMLDHALDHRLVELVGDLLPRPVGAGLGDGVAAALGESREGCVPRRAVLLAKLAKVQPEVFAAQRAKLVIRQDFGDLAKTTQAQGLSTLQLLVLLEV